jgi:hypothetical protein
VKKIQSQIANRKELVEIASEKRKGTNPEDLEDLLRCLIEYIEIKIKQDSVPAFLFPNIGYLFLSLAKAKKRMTLVEPVSKSQIRYERIQKMLMSQEYLYGKDVLSSEELFTYYKRISKLTIEELENLQNE